MRASLRYKWLRLGLAIVPGGVSLLLIMTSLGIATPAQQTVAPVPDHPSIALVSGTQLFVQKRRTDNTLGAPQVYTIKGTNWSPASSCTSQTQLPGEFSKWYITDTQIMAAMGVNTIRTFSDFGTEPTATQILDEFYRRNIMAIMTVDKTIASTETITLTVSAYKEHPAILMWAIGNEWDLNDYYHRFPTITESAAFTEWAAQTIHSLDPNHPVASILAEIDRGAGQPLLPLPWLPNTVSTRQIVNELVPSVDLWGVNVYRGATFGGLFGQWQQVSHKPMFVSEFGADSYDHRITSEDQVMQAGFDDGLWREVYLHLSARWPGRPSLGGLVFEWNDEWWKNGNACAQDITTETNPSQPDGYNDEEWFGLVNIDRQPKQAYYSMRRNFVSTASFPMSTQVTLSAHSEYYSRFFQNGAGFCYKEGGGGGGRGVNIAVMDPNTGAIEDCRNFDTWYDKQAFVTMTDYISNTILSGEIVLAAVADDGGFIRYTPPESNCHIPWSDPRVETGYIILESLGSTLIRHVGYWGSWAMIAVKGQGKLAEAYNDPVYHPPSNGYCQLQSRVPTQITVTVPITLVSPSSVMYLPGILKDYRPGQIEVSGILHAGDVCIYCCYPVTLETANGLIELAAVGAAVRQYDGQNVKVRGLSQDPCWLNGRQVIAPISIQLLPVDSWNDDHYSKFVTVTRTR